MWRQGSLIGGALLAAAIWLAEVHWHGWHGLTWLKHTDRPLVVGFIIFLTWLFLASSFLPLRRRWLLIAVVVLVIPPWHMIVDTALVLRYGLWSAPIWPLHDLSIDALSAHAILPVAIATPLFGAWILTRFGCRPEPWRISVACACYLGAVPVGIEVLSLVGFERFADPIHTFKTGVVIPPLFYGLGILLPITPQRPVALDDADGA